MTGRSFRISILFRPRVFIPLILTASLLAFALSMGDLPRVFGYMRQLTAGRLLLCLGLAFIYLVLKGLQFKWLLDDLGARVAWRPLILAYAMGELTIPLPAGVYVQNYVLQRVSGELFGFTSAATTIMLVLETVLILFTLIFLPIPGRGWVSIIALVVLLAGTVTAVGLSIMQRWRDSMLRILRSGKLKKPGQAFADMLDGLQVLMRPWIIARVTLFTVLYLIPLLIAVYVVGDGIGLSEFTLMKATSIYLSALIVVLLGGGLLTQLGTIEVVGIEVALAWGYGSNQALALLVGFRLVWLVSIWLLAGTTAAVLAGEFKHSVANNRQETTH